MFIEEILSTTQVRGRNLRIGRRLLREAIRAATGNGRVTEFHLVVRDAEQQTYAANLYALYGIGRQERRHTKNRVQLEGKLARDEQYWTGTTTVATKADQVGCPRVEGGIERYEGLQGATPAKRAAIRTAFEEVHKHSKGDKATWEKHAKETIHIAIWEEEYEGVKVDREHGAMEPGTKHSRVGSNARRKAGGTHNRGEYTTD